MSNDEEVDQGRDKGPDGGTDDSSLPADEGEYFLDIESHFAERRGTPFIFSAKDWALMKSWKAEGVPVAIVLEAIDHCFEKRREGGRRRTVSSLSYCRHAVHELWDQRKELYVGDSPSIPEEDPSIPLGRLAERVAERAGAFEEGPIRDHLNRAADEIRTLAKGKSVPQIEEALLRIEDELITRIGAQLPPDLLSRIDAQIESDLARYSSIDPVVLQRTRAANFKRLVRRELELPTLSIFG
ncbi:MAG: hypothetical protein WBX15_17700 [Thermoanaerobaculia bacterium]